MARDYQICTRCVMDTTDPEITFDAQGVCNHCHQFDVRYQKEVPRGDERILKLNAIVEKIKKAGKGREYDCVIGISGGVDSTSVAYYIKEMGLRPLAVHLDNGWNSELAVDNIKKTLQKLNIDLITHVIDWEDFRDLQLSFLKASVANCEIPTDHAITALLYHTAARENIKYIIGGGNVATEGILPKAWGYYSQDLRHLRALHRIFGSRKLSTFPQLSLPKFLYYVFVRRIKLIPILNYLDYDKKRAMKLIEDKLEWRFYGGKHYESIWTRFFQGYYLPKKFGYDKRRAHLATLVCSGQMRREDALEELKLDPYANNNLNEDRTFVLKKFQLTESEWTNIMLSPLKTYRDYPSNALVFERLSKLKAIFKRIATRA